MKRFLALTSIAAFTLLPVSGQLVINEIFYDPAGDLTGDANGDGVRSATNDEFVELVNTSDASVDLTDWVINDGNGFRHAFLDGTILASGQAIVVFGGGTPTGEFGGAIVQTASSDGLGLNNGGDTVSVLNAESIVVTSYQYGTENVDDESIVRSPDLTGVEPFVAHSSVAESGGTLFSPGTKIDGSAFEGDGKLTLSLEPATFSEGDGDMASIATVTRDGDLSAALTVTLTSGDEQVFTVPPTVVIPAEADSVTFPVAAIDNEVQEASKSVFLGAAAEGLFSTNLLVTVTDDEPNISLSLDTETISENGGVAMITLTLSKPVAVETTFELLSSDDLVLTVPQEVIIPADGTMVTFEASAIDNAEESFLRPILVTVQDFDQNLTAKDIRVIVESDEGAALPQLFISEIGDPEDNFRARFLELYNAGDADVDLQEGEWSLLVYVNGSTFADEIPLSGIVPAKGTFVIANSIEGFTIAFPSAPPADLVNDDLNSNGDESFELRLGGGRIQGILVDGYGVPGVDGTGENWDYIDSRVTRIGSVNEPNATFTIAEWIITPDTVTTDFSPGVYDNDDPVVTPTTDLVISSFTIDPATGEGEVIFEDIGSTMSYSVRESSDLSQNDSWTVVVTQEGFTNMDGTLRIRFTDAEAIGQEKRFYQVVIGDGNGGFSLLPSIFPEFPGVVLPPATGRSAE